MFKGILYNSSNKILSWVKTRKKLLIFTLALLIIGVLSFSFASNFVSDGSNKTKGVVINRSYETVARTQERLKTDGNFKLRVTNAEFADFILVQGKKATPIDGKTFLVINMEIENPYRVELYAFPVDFFRLVREDGSKFAPSVHQGTVQVRPESTKKSNVGFVVEPKEKKFKIEIGQVGEPKEVLEIIF